MKLSEIIRSLQEIQSEEIIDPETDIIVLHTNTSLYVTGKSPEGILWIGGETKAEKNPQGTPYTVRESAAYEGMFIK